MNFNEELQKRVNNINGILTRYLPETEGYQSIVMDAMEYSVSAGGKRIRPMLIQEVYKLFGGSDSTPEPFMAAMEMIHTFSLVHDDLPAMDNDDYRRGKKTTHVVFGEAIGILGGDALLNYAFEILTKELLRSEDIKVFARAMNILAEKTGIYGMIGGQAVDLISEGEEIDIVRLNYINRLKTGALMEASMMIGAVLAGAKEQDVKKIEEIASEIGMAFQIRDDILDVISTAGELGKPVLSDEKNNKTTYVTLLGIEKSGEEVEKLTSSAMNKLKSFNCENEFLNELIFNLINRKK
jgi:geranylgeranyl diphosphate synthase type II